ncbi:HEPN domain-containing protein [Desulfobacterales bacterium HSG16]|nr:HEPN domain-containing protein [Desulfobacterales bacterium HSG16]
MTEGKEKILKILSSFTGRDGEPHGDSETYVLKAMWLMMLSEFEASIKYKVENYIDQVKRKNISDIHVCLLIRNFWGNKEEELTLNKIISFYKKNPAEINYRNFTQDRVPKYKTQAVEKLFNSLGIFFTKTERTSLSILDSIASTRDSIAHGDISVQITRKQLEDQLQNLENVLNLLNQKLT